MKTNTILLLALGGGALYAFSKKKDTPLSSAAIASSEAVNAAAQAAPKNDAAKAAAREVQAQSKHIMSALLPNAVKGLSDDIQVGKVNPEPRPIRPIDIALSNHYGPFSPKNPPSPKQFAILYSVSPASAKAALPAGTAQSYLKAITADPGLVALAKESDAQKRVYNLLSLLSPNEQRAFAANCAYRSLPYLDLPPLKGTAARKLGGEIVAAAIARAEGKITAEQLEKLTKPKIAALHEIAAKAKAPAFAISTIRGLESVALSVPAAYSAEARKAVQYSNMVLSMKLNRKAAIEFNQEVASYMAKGTQHLNLPGNKGKSAAQVAEEAAEKARRKGAQEFDSEAIEKLLKKAM